MICYLVTFGICVSQDYVYGKVHHILFLFLSFATISGITFSYFSLSRLIKKFHPNRYIEIHTSMLYFFLLETLPLSIDFFNNFIRVVNDIDIGFSKDFKAKVGTVNNWLWMTYPILQAIGMLYFKQSKDPL